jgi:isoaspartyl peptidase/L-asparaginase-like protein (Ntn-hydrolase superfamily)
MSEFVLALHGGAGTVPPGSVSAERAAAYHHGLGACLRAGHAVLARGGSALDAVTAAVMALEDDALFNAGHGAVLTTDGRPEMDAAIMNGADRAAGAVAGICGPRNPILAARAVMERSPHVLLIGEGAMRFCRARGLAFAPDTYFVTQARIDALEAELARQAAQAPDTRSDADRHGTVGAVARDAAGNLAAAPPAASPPSCPAGSATRRCSAPAPSPTTKPAPSRPPAMANSSSAGRRHTISAPGCAIWGKIWRPPPARWWRRSAATAGRAG